MDDVRLTGEDAKNILDVNKRFNLELLQEDREFLKKVSKINGKLSEEQTKRVKTLMLTQIVNPDCEFFNDPLWDAPRASAQEMLEEMDE
jgi:hypothetical protein